MLIYVCTLSNFFVYSTTAVRRMGLTVAPSLSNTLLATPAASLAWTDQSSPLCHCRHQSRPNPLTPPNLQWGNTATVPPAHPTTRPSTSVPQTRYATVESASPTCQHTMRTRRWRCRCPLSEAPCWGTASAVALLISTPTPEPSALRCDHLYTSVPLKRHNHYCRFWLPTADASEFVKATHLGSIWVVMEITEDCSDNPKLEMKNKFLLIFKKELVL